LYRKNKFKIFDGFFPFINEKTGSTTQSCELVAIYLYNFYVKPDPRVSFNKQRGRSLKRKRGGKTDRPSLCFGLHIVSRAKFNAKWIKPHGRFEKIKKKEKKRQNLQSARAENRIKIGR